MPTSTGVRGFGDRLAPCSPPHPGPPGRPRGGGAPTPALGTLATRAPVVLVVKPLNQWNNNAESQEDFTDSLGRSGRRPAARGDPRRRLRSGLLPATRADPRRPAGPLPPHPARRAVAPRDRGPSAPAPRRGRAGARLPRQRALRSLSPPH